MSERRDTSGDSRPIETGFTLHDPRRSALAFGLSDRAIRVSPTLSGAQVAPHRRNPIGLIGQVIPWELVGEISYPRQLEAMAHTRDGERLGVHGREALLKLVSSRAARIANRAIERRIRHLMASGGLDFVEQNREYRSDRLLLASVFAVMTLGMGSALIYLLSGAIRLAPNLAGRHAVILAVTVALLVLVGYAYKRFLSGLTWALLRRAPVRLAVNTTGVHAVSVVDPEHERLWADLRAARRSAAGWRVEFESASPLWLGQMPRTVRVGKTALALRDGLTSKAQRRRVERRAFRTALECLIVGAVLTALFLSFQAMGVTQTGVAQATCTFVLLCVTAPMAIALSPGSVRTRIGRRVRRWRRRLAM